MLRKVRDVSNTLGGFRNISKHSETSRNLEMHFNHEVHFVKNKIIDRNPETLITANFIQITAEKALSAVTCVQSAKICVSIILRVLIQLIILVL